MMSFAAFNQRRIKALAVLALCITCLGLSACGRKGAPTPPGPENKVIYPHTYPAD